MSWNLEVKRVSGRYLNLHNVRGTVKFSRITYGGEISHYIDLDAPIEVFGAVREIVILGENEIDQVTEA